MSNEVGVVIVAYKTDALLDKLLNQLSQESCLLGEVVVVDNASQAATRRVVHAHTRNFGRSLQYLSLPNPGYGAAVNAGIGALEGSGVAVLCNADIVFEPHALEGMARVLDEDEKVAIVGPLIKGMDGTQSASEIKFPSIARTIAIMMHLHRTPLRRFQRHAFSDGGGRVEWVSGAVMALRVRDWQEGLRFDDRYFMYMEDVDICRQAVECGGSVQVCEAAHVRHVGGASSPHVSARVYVHSRLAKLLYLEKWRPKSAAFLRHVFLVEAILKARWRGPASAGPRLWVDLRADIEDGDLVRLQYDARIMQG